MRTHPSRDRAVSRAPLLERLFAAIAESGCELLHIDRNRGGHFRLAFEDPLVRRFGLTGLLFPIQPDRRHAGGVRTTIRLADASRARSVLGRDPFGLYTNVLLAVDVARDIFVAFDPSRHHAGDKPLLASFSARHVRTTLSTGWHAWEREGWERSADGFPEALIGFTGPNLLRYVQFEQQVTGLETGPRQFLAERYLGARALVPR